MRTRLLAAVAMMAVLAGGAMTEADERPRRVPRPPPPPIRRSGAMTEADERPRRGGEAEAIEKVRTILAALRVTREVVEMMEDPLLSGQLAIERVKELAIKSERLEQGAELLVRMAGGTGHPALKRSALFAASELLAKADKFEAAAAVVARVMMVDKPPAERERRVPRPDDMPDRPRRGRVKRLPRPGARPPGLPSGPPRRPPMRREEDVDRPLGPPRQPFIRRDVERPRRMEIHREQAPEQAKRAEQLEHVGERIRRAVEDLERRKRELHARAERIEHRERGLGEAAEKLEHHRRELDEVSERLERRDHELDERAEELEARAERLKKFAEELERRAPRTDRPRRRERREKD